MVGGAKHDGFMYWPKAPAGVVRFAAGLQVTNGSSWTSGVPAMRSELMPVEDARICPFGSRVPAGILPEKFMFALTEACRLMPLWICVIPESCQPLIRA